MRKITSLFFLAFVLTLQGCFVYGKKPMLSLSTIIKQKENLNSNLSSVDISNNQITINGSGFRKATMVQIKGNGVNTNLNISSISDSQIIATATSAISLLVGGTFDLIIGSVDAASTYSVTFTLQNGAVQATHLASMGASTGQILKFDGTNWGPSNLSSSQLYRGTYDASLNVPNLGTITPVAGDYFIVTVEGTYNSILYPINSWIMYNGTDWEKISNDAPVVSSFKGRRGLVVPLKGDYNLGLMTDVDLTGAGIPATDKVLTYDASGKWIAKALPAGNAGSVTNVTGTPPISVATGSSTPVISISQATTSTNGFVSSTDWNTFNGKQANIVATTSADYYRGDKTFQTLNTSTVPEFGATNIYFSNARALGVPLTAVDVTLTGAITSSDNILSAFGRTQYQLNTMTTNSSAYVTKTGNSSVPGTIDARTGFVLVGPPGTLNDATPKTYVDTQVATSVAKLGDTMTGDLILNTQAKFKDGTTKYITLKAPTTVTTAYTLTLPTAVGTLNQVLQTDASGNLSWTTPSTTAAPSGSAGGDLTGSYPNPTITGLAATKIGTGTVSNTAFGYLSAVTSDIQAQLNSKAASSLASTNILVGNGSGVATAVAVSGDAALSNAGVLTLNTVTVAKGGTGLTAGTSGGIPYYSSTSAMTASALLGLNGIMIGGGAGLAPSTLGTGISGQSLRSAGAAAPVWSNILMSDLKSSVSGNLFPGTACTTAQTLTYVLATDSFTCITTAVDAAIITTGTIAAARLPASATYWSAATGGINYAGGNVGIGTTTPSSPLDVQGGYGDGVRIRGTTLDNNWYGGIAFTNSANTGSTSIASSINGMFFNYGGVEKMRISSTGNVGIGTTSPTNAKLTITGTSVGSAGSQANISAFSSNGINIIGSVGSASQDALTYQSGSGAGGAAIAFGRNGWDTFTSFYTNSSTNMVTGGITEAMRIVGTGYVGLGTTAPRSKLDIVNNDNTVSQFHMGINTLDGLNATATSSNTVKLGVGASYESSIWTGRATAATILGMEGGVFKFYSDTTTSGTSYTPTERMRIDSSGNVGIGNAAPVSKLDVNGSVKVGVDATACSGTIAGAMRFATPNIEYCNGTIWKAFSTGVVPSTTDALLEGATNLYYTNARAVASTITAPTLTNAAIASGDSLQVVAGKLQAQVSAREPSITAGTTAQYLRGDKSLSTFATNVIASTLSGFAVGSNTTVAAADTVLGAFGKTQAQINAQTTSIGNKADLNNGSQSITASNINVTTINGAAVPVGSQWTTSGSDIYRATGNVGIGTASPASALEIDVNNLANTAGSPSTGLSLSNTTSATAGAQNQFPPALVMSGHYWLSGADTTQQVAMQIEPQTWGSTYLKYYKKIGAGAWNPFFGMRSDGTSQGSFFLYPVGTDLENIGQSYSTGYSMLNGASATNVTNQFSPAMTFISSGWNGTSKQFVASGIVQATETGSTYPIGELRFLGGYGAGDTFTSSVATELMRLSFGDTLGADFNKLALSNYRFNVTGVSSFTGNVGIGTATPGSTLDVNGSINLSGNLTTGASFTAANSATTLNLATAPTTASNQTINIGTGTVDATYTHTINMMTSPYSYGSYVMNIGSQNLGNSSTVNINGQLNANGYGATGGAINASATYAALGGLNINSVQANGWRSYVNFQNAGSTVGQVGLTGGDGIPRFQTSGATSLALGTNGSDRITILSAGNVGIGLTNPTYQLQLSTDSAAKPGTSTWTIASDARLKNIRAPFLRGLDAMEGIHPIYFKYKEGNELGLPTDKEYVGIIAQDAKKVVPEAVQTDDKGFLHVTNDSIIWTMFNGVKELYGQFKALVARVISLESKDLAKERAIASVKAVAAQANDRAAKLEAENAKLKARADKAEKENASMKKENAAVKARMDRIEQMLLKK